MKRLTTIGVYTLVLFAWTFLVLGIGASSSQDLEGEIRRIAEQVVEEHNSGLAHPVGVAGPCSSAHEHYLRWLIKAE